MSRVYLDTCVLMIAATGRDQSLVEQAVKELDRAGATYLFSSMIEMELLPQPTHNKRADELEFYKEFFASAERVQCDSSAQQVALELMLSKQGLQPMDAMHVATAQAGGASEFVTAEKSTKPMLNLGDAATPLVLRTIWPSDDD